MPAKPTVIDWNKIIFKQLTIKGIYGREMFETWHKMTAVLESGLDVRKSSPTACRPRNSSKVSRSCAGARAARSCWIG
jgi:threonine dehydrogenase-like Zn-dependent dehydrogenase